MIAPVVGRGGSIRRRKVFGTPRWEEAVYRHVAGHAETEGDILREYQGLVDDDDMAPAFRYLARIILSDEERHHRVFAELAETLRELREHDVDGDEPPIPSLRGFHTDRVVIRRVTDRLLQVERDDLSELERLSKELRELRKINLWSLLVELMIDDTKKHIKILEFMRDRAEDQPD